MVLRTKARWVWFVVIVIYLVGLVGFLLPALHDLFIFLIPINILFACTVLFLGEEDYTLKKVVLFLVCFLFGYGIELLGTQTGLIFGTYAYGGGLGVTVWGVPLLIGVNWFFMVYTSLHVVQTITQNRWLIAFIAPVFMVLYDFFLEPFAMENNMWNWANNEVPIQNYIAWYFGGLFLTTSAVMLNIKWNNRYAVGLYGIQILFFVLLYIF